MSHMTEAVNLYSKGESPWVENTWITTQWNLLETIVVCRST